MYTVVGLVFLFGMGTCSSVDMGSCTMVCDESSLESPSRKFVPGPPGKKGPQGPVGPIGPRGEPAEPCICPEHNELQNQIDDLNEKLRRIHSPLDCTEVLERKTTQLGGAYTIFPNSFGDRGIDIYCNTETESGGWMVFQRREDGSVDFFRGWSDYENGFGDVNGEFWLGLQNIHQLTKDGKYELRVDMADFEGNTAYAKYSTFEIGGPETFYNATMSGYSGTAGDCLGLNSVPFSTKDQDHDTWPKNCADNFKGAMWYISCHCAHPNGLYLKGRHDSFANGVNWHSWKGYHYSLKFLEMKIRKAA